MEQYQDLIRRILENGNYRPNRTSSDTISTFSQHYEIDLQKGFPLLTTKDLSGFRWRSLIHELIWYFSGEHHIKDLKEKTGIWNAWADEDWNLPTAYGRFWRRYPIPDEKDQLEGEWWVNGDQSWIDDAVEWYDDVSEEDIREGMERWINEEDDGTKTLDQIQYAIDTLNGDHPYRGPESRRIIINAWHPSNAVVSKLPPCHFTYVLNVQDGKLNCHLTQRSADTALGVPFNIAAYALITKIIAKQTDFEVGKFSHTLVDAHIYCGKGERGKWYDRNIEELQKKVSEANSSEEFIEIKEWIEEEAPEEKEDDKGYDHVPNLLKQLSREPRERPEMEIADKDLNDLEYEDFELKKYDPHPGLKFSVAE